MRKAFRVSLCLIILVMASCGSGDSRYDQNTAVPKGDPQFPPLGTSWVIDKSGVLSESAIAAGDAICQKLKEDGIAEVVVVLISGVKHPEDWATHYGRWLGLGKKGLSTEEGNNGIVWLIRPDAQEKLTISVGRGLPKFSTVDYGAIMDKTIEYLNFDNFDKGVMELITQTDRDLREIYGNKEPRPKDGALKPKIQNQTEIPNQARPGARPGFGMTETVKPNPVVMLNSFQHLWPDARTDLFQHLVCFFLLPADALFSAVHEDGGFQV